MAPIVISRLASEKSTTCYYNCTQHKDLSGLGALVVVVFLIVLAVVYFYKLNKAKRLYREQNIPYSKRKIFGSALLWATVVGLVVLCLGEQSSSTNTGNGGNGTAPQATSGGGGGAGSGVGSAMGQQMRMEDFAANMNNMGQAPLHGAAVDGVQ